MPTVPASDAASEPALPDLSTPPDAALARRLVATQFPGWADLPVSEVSPQGHDNRSFRLGDDLVVRLPSAARYAGQPAKEAEWLPRLAPRLPFPVPEVVAQGQPGEGYPYPWSVRRWIEGRPVTAEDPLTPLARDLARFLRVLQSLPTAGGPAAGEQNFHRGGDLLVCDDETRSLIERLADRYDAAELEAIWDRALASSWQHAPVWVHGDIAANNLLVRDGALAAVIDFGSSGVGDPSSDLVITWTLFEGESRAAFRLAMPYDAETWERAAGWALWKALLTVAEGGDPVHDRVIRDLIAEAREDG